MKTLKISLIALLFLIASCLDDPGSASYDDTEDLAFLEEYAQQNNVTETNSGLLYRVIEEGEGATPASNRHSVITYEGESVNGSAEYTTGESFEIIVPDELVNFTGIGEGIQLMNVGALYEFVMPSDLATGDGRVYVFQVRLESYLEEDQEQFLVDNGELENIEETESGLQYRVIEEGDGDTPLVSSSVSVKYKGSLTSGYIFDKSPNDETVEFEVGGVIPGFSEGLQLMKEGSKYEFFIPPALGYQNEQHLLYGVVLKFEVDLVEIE